MIIRGVNKQNLFQDEEDRQHFLDTLERNKFVSMFDIYCYCLMTNHIHLLIKEIEEPLSQIMKRISGRYVYLYNSKYNRCGHLFQERFRSEPVESDEYFLTVVRYIHQNPVKAGLSSSVSEYRWSSYRDYLHKNELISSGFVLKMFADDPKKALGLFEQYMNEPNNDRCLEYETRPQVSDSAIKTYLTQQGINNVSDFQQLDKKRRNEILTALKLMEGATIRQISRLTGIAKSVIGRL